MAKDKKGGARVGDGTGFGKGPPTKSGDSILEGGPQGSNPGGPAEKTGGAPVPVKSKGK